MNQTAKNHIKDCVNAAHQALIKYHVIKREGGIDSLEEIANDLLTDLRHLCDDEKIDFNRLIATSQMHHKAEADEAGGAA
jgi:hypothetical protein